MEHGKKNRKFGRTTKQRSAMMRSLAIALIEKKKISTTEAKAKSLKVFVEKLISRGKKNDLLAIRFLTSSVGNAAAMKLIKEISPKYLDKKGGYIRLRKLAPRISDGSSMAVIELIQ